MSEELNDILNEVDRLHNFNDFSKVISKLANLRGVYSNYIEDYKHELKIIDYELTFLNFRFKNGTLSPQYVVEGWCFKDIGSFTEDCIEYLKDKCQNTVNLFLKSYYSLILFNSSNVSRNEKRIFKDNFIEYSIGLKNFFYENNYQSPEDIKTISLCLINALNISNFPQYKEEKVHNSFMEFINDETIDFGLKYELIHSMFNSYLFDNDDFSDLDEYCFKWAQHNSPSELSCDFLMLAKKINNKLCVDENHSCENEFKRKCDVCLAQNYENLIELVKQPLLKMMHYCRAINIYRDLGDSQKSYDLQVSLAKFKDNNKNILGEMSLNYTLNENKYERNLKNDLTNFSELIDYLINKDCLLPSLQTSDELYQEYLKKEPLSQILNLKPIHLDSNSNFLKNPFGDKSYEEIVHEFNLKLYNECLNENCINLNFLLFDSYEKGFFSLDSVLNYLQDYEFFNTHVYLNFDLLFFIKPVFQDYFNDLNFCYENTDVNFILFIDAMALRLELLFRELAKHRNVRTIDVATDNTSSERSLNQLFKDSLFKSIFEDNIEDYNFFNHVLLKEGLNLRNKVAHGLDLSIYNFTHANLLLLCFFRLLKYLDMD